MIHQSEYQPDMGVGAIHSMRAVECHSSTLNRKVTIEFKCIEGCLYGLAVGDARGLPFETLPRDQIAEILNASQQPYYPLTSNSYLKDSVYEPGQVSDDLDLSLALLKACIEGIRPDGLLSMESVGKFHLEVLNRGPVGWGPGTRKAVEAFGAGVPWELAGEVNAGEGKGLGNGIPMKIASIGIYAALTDLPQEQFEHIVRGVAIMSHPKSMAVSAGLAHAAAIRYCLSVTPDTFSRKEFVDTIVEASRKGERYLPETKGKDDITAKLAQCIHWQDYSDEKIHEEFGGGVCYVYHSLPFSYMHFLQDPFSFETVERTIRAGGDTDSNAAFVGALIGALHGKAIVPEELIAGLRGADDLEQTLTSFWRRFAV